MVALGARLGSPPHGTRKPKVTIAACALLAPLVRDPAADNGTAGCTDGRITDLLRHPGPRIGPPRDRRPPRRDSTGMGGRPPHHWRNPVRSPVPPGPVHARGRRRRRPPPQRIGDHRPGPRTLSGLIPDSHAA